jgi:hypothetical protein
MRSGFSRISGKTFEARLLSHAHLRAIIAVAHLHQEPRDWRVRLKSNRPGKPNPR